MNEKRHFETNAIRTQTLKTQQNEHSTPIFATSSFLFDNAEHARAVFAEEEEGNIYTRFTNPNTDEFVKKMCLLEGTEDGIATSSGMAAVFLSFISFLQAGDHIIASKSLFGTTHTILDKILPRFGISHTYINVNASLDDWKKAIMPQTKIIYIETPSNPGLDVIEIQPLADLANENNCLLVVDNCFATPYIQRPVEFGAHIICHSATKFIDGQGRTIGGVILGDETAIAEVRMVARATGPTMSPFNAWVLSKSLETLSVRVEKHCENALKLAEFLEDHPEVQLVKYPFLKNYAQLDIAQKQMKLGGGLVSFEVKGSLKRCQKFINSLQMLSITSNLGDTRTTITHPATTTHSKLDEENQLEVGITPSLLRISVGLEHIDDIKKDIDKALLSSK